MTCFNVSPDLSVLKMGSSHNRIYINPQKDLMINMMILLRNSKRKPSYLENVISYFCISLVFLEFKSIFASFIKLAIIKTITIPIGNAATMLTD